MLKDLVKEGGLYTLANLLTKGISLLLLPFYANYFTQGEYGILAMLGIAGAVSSAIFSVQIYQGVGRYISQPDTTHEEKQRIGSSGLWFTIISYAIFLLLAVFFKDNVINILSEDERIEDATYLWSLGAIAINGIFNALSVQLKFLRKTKAFSITTFLNAILTICLILFFTLGLGMRVESVYIATIVVVPLLILLQLHFLKGYIIFHLNKKHLKKLLRFSVPLVPAAIAYLVLNLTDRIFIKELSGSLAKVGLYEMAFKFSAIFSIIIISFQSALAPLVYEKHSEKETPSNLAKILRLFIGVGTLGGICLAFFSYETLYIFTQPKYYAADVLMPLFYLSVLITGAGMFSVGLHLKNKTKIIPVIVTISAIMNIGLNYWLIPIYGLLGAAFATLISTLFNNLTLFIISQKLYKIPIETRKTILVLTVFTIVFGIGSYFKEIVELPYIYHFIIKLGLIVLYLLFLLRVKFISFEQLKTKLLRK